MSVAENAVGSIWIIDVHAQEKIALRVEPVEFLEAFGNLRITEPALWAENTGGRANAVLVNEYVGLGCGMRGPEFQGGFLFESTK